MHFTEGQPIEGQTDLNESLSCVKKQVMPADDFRPDAMKLRLQPVAELAPAERVALERLAFEHGELPDSYLAVESYRSCFLSADLTAAASMSPEGSSPSRNSSASCRNSRRDPDPWRRVTRSVIRSERSSRPQAERSPSLARKLVWT